MIPIIIYAAKTIVCSCAFILLYMWQFHKKVHYKYCRIYLMATMLLSAVIPAMNVPIYPNQALQAQSDVQYIGDTAANESETTVIRKETVSYSEPPVFAATVTDTDTDTKAAATVKKTDWKTIGLIIYLSFIAVTIILTIRSLLRIWRLRAESELTSNQDFSIAKNSNVKTPFTFIKTIFVGNSYTDDEWRQIISHEASHARHLHSVERMAMTLLRTVFWFNPFMWIAAKCLEEVQEWQADNDAINDGYAIEQYRLTILHQIFGCAPNLSLGMSNSFTKNRFIMMTQKLNRKCTRPAVLAAAVAVGAFFAFGCTTQTFARNEQTANNVASDSISKTMIMSTHAQFPSNNDTTSRHIIFHFDKFAYDSDDVLTRGNRWQYINVGDTTIETFEYLQDGHRIAIAAANNVRQASDLQSSELDWVNENTSIFLGGRLISFADFKKLKNEDVYGIIYQHLNSNMDFVLVNPYLLSTIDYRICHQESSFYKQLPDVVPIVSYSKLKYENDYIQLLLSDAKGNKNHNLIVPIITDYIYFDGHFGSFDDLKNWKVPRKCATLYKGEAAKNRFGKNYDFVIEITSEPVTTNSPKAPANIEDFPSASSTFLKDFHVSLAGSIGSIAQQFNVRLWEGTVYQIWSGTDDSSSTGRITATLTDGYGNECGYRYSVQNGQPEVIQFYCEKTGDYNINVRSKNGGDVKGTCTLRYVNE